MMRLLAVPVATYRIQFNLNFRFVDATNLVPYFHDLGITHLYVSPRFKARKGSSHGYGVADPLRINSELGTEQEFDDLVRKLKSYGMGLLLDIVPNHMVASHENPWWMDVLENGPSSEYARYFDIEWHPAAGKGLFLQDNRVLIPVLGDRYGKVLENQELSLKLDENGFYIRYYEHRFPVNPTTYRVILEYCLQRIRAARKVDSSLVEEVSRVLDAVKRLPAPRGASRKQIENRREAHEWIKHRLWERYQHSAGAKRSLDDTLRFFNGIQGEGGSFEPLDHLLSEQAYRLAYWKMASEEINYRRFFDINELVGLRVEESRVFDDRHRLIVELARKEGMIGLRVDHVDGLLDPAGYLERLRAATAAKEESRNTANRYLIVEKILGREEPLPADWPVAGTTGYDFLNAVNGLFVDPAGLASLDKDFCGYMACESSYAEVCHRRNKQVIYQLFAGELAAFTRLLAKLASQSRHARDISLPELVRAFVEVTACLPVYRTYVRSFSISDRDRVYLEWTLEAARRRVSPEEVSNAAWDFLRRVLFLDLPPYASIQPKFWLEFVMRWQQFTSPVMAKGLEDTASYVYNSLISLNEVGGDSQREKPPYDVPAFHAFNQTRLDRWRHTMNATSTHDTKRSEDVRARVNVLSEIDRAWLSRLHRWSKWNRHQKTEFNGQRAPDYNEECLLYQTMLGAWPLDPAEEDNFLDRLIAFMEKALREAKVHTSWIDPDLKYERAVETFIRKSVGSGNRSRFMADFLELRKVVSFYGHINSLSQTLLKITSPGVPDFYQGTELWDFSLVDPDNRRPVDFEKRVRMIEELKSREAGAPADLLKDLVSTWQDGRIKLYLIRKALNFRLAHKELFASGEYVPLDGAGQKRARMVAFARRRKIDWAIIAVPRLIVGPGSLPRRKLLLSDENWPDLKVVLPRDCPIHWRNIFTQGGISAKRIAGGRSLLHLSEMLHRFPCVLLQPVPQKPAPR
ncbi:MAG TPA: malto-oligosyltrehalose synthase [Terriglobia bacterium]|nr:malto-oligosyltrehalose synthase [Terriglobia bacterium]